MTLEKRIEHIWEYYRWQILLALVAVCTLIGIAVEWSGRNVPDYEIAVVTRQMITEEEADLLTDAFRTAAEQVNPKRDNVLLTAFHFDPIGAEEESGPYLDIYNGVTLNAELTSGNCLIFLVDRQAYGLLTGQGEDFLASIGAEPYLPLSRLMPQLPESLGELRVCLRSPESVFMESAESARSRFEAHEGLVNALLSGMTGGADG